MDWQIVKPLKEREGFYNSRCKYYPDGTTQITVFNKPIFNPNKLEEVTGHKKLYFKSGTYNMDSTRDDSIRRSQKSIEEISLANDWEGMVTLTLSPEQIDRYDKEIIHKRISKWLNNMQQRHNIDYLVIPEYHKDGAVHFHGLMNFGNMHLIDSGTKEKHGKTQYNIKEYKYGFSLVVLLDENKMAVARYISKYVTKDTKKIFGSFYLSGGNIKRKLPCEYANIDYDSFNGKEYTIKHTNISVKYASIK